MLTTRKDVGCSGLFAYNPYRQDGSSADCNRNSIKYIKTCSTKLLLLMLCAELETKQLTLIDIVQSLGEYINNQDGTIRSKAIDYLSQIIGALSPTFLTRQQTQVLCQFLCDRIEDEGAVGGLAKLQGLGRFNKDMAIMTLRA